MCGFSGSQPLKTRTPGDVGLESQCPNAAAKKTLAFTTGARVLTNPLLQAYTPNLFVLCAPRLSLQHHLPNHQAVNRQPLPILTPNISSVTHPDSSTTRHLFGQSPILCRQSAAQLRPSSPPTWGGANVLSFASHLSLLCQLFSKK